jgi:hypothetical protein
VPTKIKNAIWVASAKPPVIQWRRAMIQPSRQNGDRERCASRQEVRGRPADIERSEQAEQNWPCNSDETQECRTDL